MKTSAALFLILGTSNLAVGAMVVNRDLQSFHISSDNCSDVRESVAALKEWKAQTGASIQKCNPRIEGSTHCSANILECVPNHVAEFSGIRPLVDGPNCWNLSLVMKGILPNLRYTTNEEMNFYMRPPLCRQLKGSEERRPGDVGAIRSIRSDGVAESHGFIYISKSIAYSKNGFRKRSPYQLQPLENVLSGYDVEANPNCRMNRVDVNSGCKEAVAYFRCQSLSQYLDQHPEIPAQLRRSFDELAGFEKCLEKSVLEGKPLRPKAREGLIEVTRALTHYMRTQEARTKLQSIPEGTAKFVLGSLRLRLLAIEEQLNISHKSPLQKELLEFATDLQTSMSEIDQLSPGAEN